MVGKDLTLVHERLARLETSDTHQTKKINEIHKALVGNGQPGMIAEWNQWKGGVRLFSTIVGVFLTILTVSVGALAYVK